MTEQLVALSPTEVPAVQTQLADWCRGRIVGLGRELREQRQNLRIAKASKWKHSGWVNQINRTKHQMLYYAKIRAAVQAGYLIIPNFDIDVMAVRVQRSYPDRKSETYDSYKINHAAPQLLPPGVGRYVGDKHQVEHDEREVLDSQNRKVTKHRYTVIDYEETLDFPVKMIKPQILDATQLALSRKIFDRIGIVKGTKRSDPIVIGQVIDPRDPDRVLHPKVISFFIAWWLDPETL